METVTVHLLSNICVASMAKITDMPLEDPEGYSSDNSYVHIYAGSGKSLDTLNFEKGKKHHILILSFVG